MRVLKLVPLFSIMLLLGGQVLFPSGPAYALGKPCCLTCSDCNSPLHKCWCPGLNNCPWFYCASDPDDSLNLLAQALTNNERLDVAGAYSASPVPLRSYSIDRLIARMSSSQCDKNNFTRKFFRRDEDQLKFEPDFLKYNVSQNNDVLAFHIPMKEAK